MELNLQRFEEARNNIKAVVRRTPMFYSDTFSEETDCKVYLKCENKQKTGAFKLRGAYNKISKLSEEEKSRGVIASSAGNHAQGVAYAATMMGIKSTIVMPVTAPQAKVNATKGYGAEVVQCGEVYDECYKKAVEIQKATGAVFIHPFNDEEIIAGQGTIAMEILEDLPETDAIIVPVGGGGLIAGVAMAAKLIKPDIKIIGVEPAIIPSCKVSLERGFVTTLPGIKSLADGISVSTLGDVAFKYIKKYVDEVVTVSEDEIARGMFSLIERSKLVCEGAGASTVAALLSHKINLKGKNVVALLSGGNIDIAILSKIIDRELILSRRRISFTVEIQDKVGQLEKIINTIVCLGGNVVKAMQDRNWCEKGLDYANVIFEIEVQSEKHGNSLIEAIIKNGYSVRLNYR